MDDIHNIQWPGWETVRLIGEGNFGSVYEIQRSVFDDIEKAALKVISIPYNRSDISNIGRNHGTSGAQFARRCGCYLD